MDIMLYLIMLVIPLLAQFYVMSNYNKYKKVEIKKRLSGFEVARKILDENGLEKIHVVETKGKLSDHYDPSRKVIRLSHEVFHGETISAASIAAHEVGHAIQDKEGYLYMRIRSLIFPIVKIGTQLSYIILVIGFLSEAMGLIQLGIGLVALGLIFQLVTLPVEFNASSRAKKELNKLSLIGDDEEVGVKSVLGAAAMTYVAGVLTSLIELVRLILIYGNRD